MEMVIGKNGLEKGRMGWTKDEWVGQGTDELEWERIGWRRNRWVGAGTNGWRVGIHYSVTGFFILVINLTVFKDESILVIIKYEP